MRLRLAVVVLITTVGVPLLPNVRRAQACSCSPFLQETYPTDGAADVPLNTLVVVATDLSEGTPDVRIVDEEGAPIDGTVVATQVRISPPSAWLVFSAATPLAPNTQYTIEVAGVERSVFSTGTDELSENPDLGEVLQVQAVLRPEGNPACWQSGDALDEVSLELDHVGDTVSHLIVEVRASTESSPSFVALVPKSDIVEPDTIVLSTNECDPMGPSLEVGAEYCVRVTAYDQAGNSRAVPEACAAPASCIGQGTTGRCAPSDGGCSVSGRSLEGLIGALLVLLWTARLRRR